MRLPRELRALHAAVGKDARFLRSTRGTARILEASELTIEDGTLLLMKGRSDGATVYFGAAQKAMERLEKALELPLEWL